MCLEGDSGKERESGAISDEKISPEDKEQQPGINGGSDEGQDPAVTADEIIEVLNQAELPPDTRKLIVSFVEQWTASPYPDVSDWTPEERGVYFKQFAKAAEAEIADQMAEVDIKQSMAYDNRFMAVTRLLTPFFLFVVSIGFLVVTGMAIMTGDSAIIFGGVAIMAGFLACVWGSFRVLRINRNGVEVINGDEGERSSPKGGES